MRGLFVTGTGTGVGKTVVAAALARTATTSGERVSVFKPAVSGLDEVGEQPADHELLRLASGSTQRDEEIAPYRYGPAASPHLAAELAGERIDPVRLVMAARSAAGRSDQLVCEGVGGFLVPLAPRYLVRDLARDLGMPVVIAASPGLGTINHTLLTAEAVWGAGLEPAAVVLTPWPEDPSAIEESNRSTIGALTGIEVLTLPEIDLARPGHWPALEAPRKPSVRAA